MALHPDNVMRRSDRTAWQNFDQEVVVMDVPSHTLLGLNKLGGWVWDRLDGTQSLQQLARTVADLYNQPLAVVLADVLTFAEELSARGCVECVSHDSTDREQSRPA